jgi:peptidoglycan-N-acetylglucosamine deacetylase
VRPTHWRTPWGVRTAATQAVAARHGLTLVDWTLDTHDWRGDLASSMLARASSQLTPGAVVLMHDALGPGALRSGCQNTVELIEPLVIAARARGLRVEAITRGGLPEPHGRDRALPRSVRGGAAHAAPAAVAL